MFLISRNVLTFATALLVGFLSYSSYSQSAAIDSLDRLLISHKSLDTTRVLLLNAKSAILRHKNPERAIGLLKEADSLSVILDFKKGREITLGFICIYYLQTGHHYAALNYAKEKLKIVSDFNDLKGIASANTLIGHCFNNLGDYEQALNYYLRALKIAEENNFKDRISSVLINIGVLYARQENNEMALEYYFRALELAEELDNTSQIISLLSNLGEVYILQENYQKASEYFGRAMKLAIATEDQRMLSILNMNYATLSKSMNEYEKALEFLKKSVRIAEENNFETLIVFNYELFCEVYYQLKDFRKSIEVGEKGLGIAEVLEEKERIKQLSFYLSQSYAAINNFKKAFYYHTTFKTQSDSLLNKESIQRITSQSNTYQFEKEKRELQIEQAKKDAMTRAEEKQRIMFIYALVISFILMAIIVRVILKSYRQKKKLNQMLSQKNVSLAEANNKLTHQKDQIEQQKNILDKQRIEIEKINKNLEIVNNSLEKKVKDRTNKLRIQNKQLAEYAFMNSHLLRAPIARILGIVNLLKSKTSPSEKKELTSFLEDASLELDTITRKISEVIHSEDIQTENYIDDILKVKMEQSLKKTVK